MDSFRVPALLNVGYPRRDSRAFRLQHGHLDSKLTCEGEAGPHAGSALWRRRGAWISSLWPIDEFASKQFMGRFYENMLERGDSPSAALRNTQLWMKNTPAWTDPVNWAAFEISGSLPLRQSGNKTSNFALNK